LSAIGNDAPIAGTTVPAIDPGDDETARPAGGFV
jgi:hypothetical protein